MTEPYYCVDLRPGMIADYRVDFPVGQIAYRNGVEYYLNLTKKELIWVGERFKGLFWFNDVTTASSRRIQVSNQEDELLLKMAAVKATKSAYSVYGFSRSAPQKVMNVDDFRKMQAEPYHMFESHLLYGPAANPDLLTWHQEIYGLNLTPIEDRLADIEKRLLENEERYASEFEWHYSQD